MNVAMVHELLCQARSILSDPAHFTQRTYARDAHGDPCFCQSPTSVCYCAAGALRHLTRDRQLIDAAWMMLDSAAFQLFGPAGTKQVDTTCTDPMITVNDTLGHTAVLQCFDSAISHTAPTT
jgi:hypothetical protein